MYLRSIEMKGFKSFPERTKLEFSPGVSVIVGPNGSGKSNITDAVLWALGEQSPGAIRGASMQDVISAGGKGVGQRRAAEVEVVIDNSEGRAATELSEIAIQRTPRPLRRRRLPAQRRPLPPRRRRRGPLRHQPRPRDALGDQPGPGRDDHPLQAARAASADRGGGGARQAPQAPPPGRAEAARRARQPRPRARPRARGAGAPAAAEAPGAGGRARGADRARGAGACAAAWSPRSCASARIGQKPQRRLPRRRAPSGRRSRSASPRSASAAAPPRSASPARDRERTQAWGVLTKLRGEQQRIAVRAAVARRSRARSWSEPWRGCGPSSAR